jgi:aspartyl/glutamyl-tRNA(Asn/Gln) amidotransferase C subunit
MAEKIDQEQVKKVAKLSRLDLTDSEIEEFTGQLGAILEYVEKMNELDTENVEPLAHCLPVSNVFREPRKPLLMLRREMRCFSECQKYLMIVLGHKLSKM